MLCERVGRDTENCFAEARRKKNTYTSRSTVYFHLNANLLLKLFFHDSRFCLLDQKIPQPCNNNNTFVLNFLDDPLMLFGLYFHIYFYEEEKCK